jgi:tetratricopeptide (TPR) repeat protein
MVNYAFGHKEPLADYAVRRVDARRAGMLGSRASAVALACLLISSVACATLNGADRPPTSEEDAVAVRAFHQMASGSAEGFQNLRERDIEHVLAASRRIDPTGGEELRIHETLAARNYRVADGTPDDRLRVDHARLLVQRGEIERARQRLETVVDPREILVLRVSRVFDPLRGDEAFERQLDLQAVARARVARARAAASADPRNANLVLELASSLNVLGRAGEALTEIDRALARARAPASRSRLDDIARKRNWLLGARCQALYNLDRPVEALSACRSAIGAGGTINVSQVLNFASMLERRGSPAAALRVLRLAGRMSPYGRMWMASVRACAAKQLGDSAMVQEAMSYLRRHERDNVAALARALLCVNDIDGAAALYIRRLGNPAEQEEALIVLQIYGAAEGGASRRPATQTDYPAHVRERADVRAAIELVGRIEEVPLPGADWRGW